MNYYLLMWKRGFKFSGRSTRSEYWFATLFNSLIMLLVYGVFIAFNYKYFVADPIEIDVILANFIFLYVIIGLYGLATFIPMLALTVRRLHDIGRSGLWMVYTIVFCFILGVLNIIFYNNDIGAIIVACAGLAIMIMWLVFLVTASQPGTNKYGANPNDAQTFSSTIANNE